MKRIGTILDGLADAQDSDIGRLLAMARLATQQRQGMGGGDEREEDTRHRASGRHCLEAKRPGAGETGEESAEGTKPPASQGGVVNATTKRGRSCRSGVTLRLVWTNPSMPTMDMCLGRARRNERISPRSALSRHMLMLVVIEGGRKH